MTKPLQTHRHDLAIIGTGPAGMAAAIEARKHGLSVAVFDDGSQPGGRIYHAVDHVVAARPADAALFGVDYTHGESLTRDFRQSGADHYGQSSVFRVDPDGVVWFTRQDKARTLRAGSVILATGAMERPVPVKGWTLPGVMTAGAAQLLLKGDNMIPEGPIVLMGAGPLVLLCAVQLHDAGARVTAVVETTTRLDMIAALPHLPRALLAYGDLLKGIALRRRLKQAGIALYPGASNLRLTGDSRVDGVDFHWRGRNLSLDADSVLLHNGVVPETHLSRQIGCRHSWIEAQRCWRPDTDAWGLTSVPSVYVAGDGGGIGGARAAECAGHIAALRIAVESGRLGVADGQRLAHPWQRARDRHLAIRPFLDRLFRPLPELLSPPDDETIVCRCEEVTAATVRQAIALGCPGPNQLKSFCRAGMGPCQGRMCQLTLTEMMARSHNARPDDIGALNIRPPVRPVSVAALAAMVDDSD